MISLSTLSVIIPLVLVLIYVFYLQINISVSTGILWGHRCYVCKEHIDSNELYLKINLKCCKSCNRRIKIKKLRSLLFVITDNVRRKIVLGDFSLLFLILFMVFLGLQIICLIIPNSQVITLLALFANILLWCLMMLQIKFTSIKKPSN